MIKNISFYRKTISHTPIISPGMVEEIILFPVLIKTIKVIFHPIKWIISEIAGT
jgi:hypothetical protein